MKKVILAIMAVLLFTTNSFAEIVTKEISYKDKDVSLKGFLAYDDAVTGKRPGVLVVHEWWGHNEYAKKRAVMLAELGYVAFALDMYGEGKLAEHPDDAMAFSNEVMKNVDEVLKPRFLAGLNVLKSQDNVDPEQIAAVGYCFGGSTILHMARLGVDLKGVVSFHGGITSPVMAQEGKVKAKILVCNGEADPFVTEDQITAFNKEMTDAKADYKFINYSGASHSFTNPEADEFSAKFGLPLKYNQEADTQSWKDMQEFFVKIFQ